MADLEWAHRNLGYDPVNYPLMTAPVDLQRQMIDFDSEGEHGKNLFGVSSKATGLSEYKQPDFRNLAPQTGLRPSPKGLPKAKVLVVTWTVDEGHALSRVLTPGKDSANDYVPYTKNFSMLSKQMSKGSPAVKAGRLGAYWTTRIGNNSAVILKSESHLSQDTDKQYPENGTLPNATFWQQIIADVEPELIITTGTGGGIGTRCIVGDVVVSPVVGFNSRKWLTKAPFAQSHYASSAPITKYFFEALSLFKANADKLPKDNHRAPEIQIVPANATSGIVTTDYFGFDTSDNFYKLQGLGHVSEMGDAVLGLVMSTRRKRIPWVAVRNVSDPQINSKGLTLEQQASLAAHIYMSYGRWSSICSAITCWALIAAL